MEVRFKTLLDVIMMKLILKFFIVSNALLILTSIVLTCFYLIQAKFIYAGIWVGSSCLWTFATVKWIDSLKLINKIEDNDSKIKQLEIDSNEK